MIEEEYIKEIFGMPVPDVLNAKKKLSIIGISMSELIEFLDRDKVQLFAEQQCEIKMLKNKLSEIYKFIEGTK